MTTAALQHATSQRRVRLRHKVYARWCKLRLDRALATGADARTNPVLAARAAMLHTRREREALATAIYRVLKETTRSSFSTRAPIARESVELNRSELLALAAELRQASTVSARGVAAVRLLLTDGITSPLYRRAAPRSLSTALANARRWL